MARAAARPVKLSELPERDLRLVLEAERRSLSLMAPPSRRKLTTTAKVRELLEAAERRGDLRFELTRRAVLIHYTGSPGLSSYIQRTGKKAGVATLAQTL